VFFLFQTPPLVFNPVKADQVRGSARAGEFAELERQFASVADDRGQAARVLAAARRGANPSVEAEARERFAQSEADLRQIRRQAGDLVRDVTGDEGYGRFTGDVPAGDVNYIFPNFVTTYLPMGLVGLIIAAILAAAMSTIAAELNSLATASVIDIYRRHLKPVATDHHLLLVSRGATAFWGLFAAIVAMYATSLGSLIEVVNRFGSFFYGSILGVFILAIGLPRTTSNAAFLAIFAGMGSVAWTFLYTNVAFLWHNVIGAVAVVIVGMIVTELELGWRGSARREG
jgi:hypothetical protein